MDKKLSIEKLVLLNYVYFDETNRFKWIFRKSGADEKDQSLDGYFMLFPVPEPVLCLPGKIEIYFSCDGQALENYCVAIDGEFATEEKDFVVDRKQKNIVGEIGEFVYEIRQNGKSLDKKTILVEIKELYVESHIGPEGGSVEYPEKNVKITFQAGSFTSGSSIKLWSGPAKRWLPSKMEELENGREESFDVKMSQQQLKPAKVQMKIWPECAAASTCSPSHHEVTPRKIEVYHGENGSHKWELISELYKANGVIEFECEKFSPFLVRWIHHQWALVNASTQEEEVISPISHPLPLTTGGENDDQPPVNFTTSIGSPNEDAEGTESEVSDVNANSDHDHADSGLSGKIWDKTANAYDRNEDETSTAKSRVSLPDSLGPNLDDMPPVKVQKVDAAVQAEALQEGESQNDASATAVEVALAVYCDGLNVVPVFTMAGHSKQDLPHSRYQQMTASLIDFDAYFNHPYTSQLAKVKGDEDLEIFPGERQDLCFDKHFKKKCMKQQIFCLWGDGSKYLLQYTVRSRGDHISSDPRFPYYFLLPNAPLISTATANQIYQNSTVYQTGTGQTNHVNSTSVH